MERKWFACKDIYIVVLFVAVMSCIIGIFEQLLIGIYVKLIKLMIFNLLSAKAITIDAVLIDNLLLIRALLIISCMLFYHINYEAFG